MGYDLRHDPDQFILTHARAFQVHPGFELVGGVDLDSERVCRFEMEYSRPGYVDLASALHDLKPNVVVIATPTALHYQTVSTVLEVIKPSAILCEKPLAYDLDEAAAIVTACEDQGVKLYVNYIRRSDCGVAEIKARINDGRITQSIKGVCWYSKGLFNNGSHFLNLLQYWLGEVVDYQILNKGRLLSGLDPEPDVCINFERGTIYFLAAREEYYSHYTIELIAGNGRLRYECGGSQILWQSVIANPTCEGYQILNSIPEAIISNLDRCQWQVADQLVADLAHQEARICSGSEALYTLKVLNQIVQSR
ncbi:MAG: Gfo/Idh/MocA family oxidoreductase [Candidatus Competibacteraceae bacterium]|nr:Gfo/Idh/MocA family oxidoreductase [Candidatus Competibacteraceae bacterium]MCP5125056.1 Gfo/Idh/MocA family oxidoreductase [Gammaproteobacteria bacterium]